MALVTTKKMFEKAFEGGYAIGAFNINNMEIIQGVVAAAKAQNSAVILQVSKSALKYAHQISEGNGGCRNRRNRSGYCTASGSRL